MTEQRQTTKILLVAILAIVLAFVLMIRMGAFTRGPRKDSPVLPAQGSRMGPSETGEVKNGASTGVQVQWKRPEPIGPTINDPMHMDSSKSNSEKIEPAAPVATEPEFRVAGIVFSTEQPSSVIIDGHILHEGDTIHGATIVRITETYAEFSRGDKKWQIRAGQSNKELK